MNTTTKIYATPEIIHEGNISVRAGTPPSTRREVQPVNLFGDD